MRVRMLSLGAGPEGIWPPGSTIEVAAPLAAQLIASGHAEAVDKPPVVAAEVEVADDAGAESRRTAVGPGQRKRTR